MAPQSRHCRSYDPARPFALLDAFGAVDAPVPQFEKPLSMLSATRIGMSLLKISALT
jgi:hypothetical protein